MKPADYLCGAGVVLIAASLWMVHPSLAGGWLGVIAIALGVLLHRRRP